MNMSNFLLIDIAFLLAVTPILFFIQRKKTTFSRIPSKADQAEKKFYKIPNKDRLLELEKKAKEQGSGIELNLIIGNWKFISVYKKNTDEENSIFSSLLRVFNASLELKKNFSTESSDGFSIIISIQFGLLTLEFSGSSYLKGIHFCFKHIELKSGSRVLFSRYIDEAIEKEKLFFDLIASDKSGGWLLARGQTGSLILWEKD